MWSSGEECSAECDVDARGCDSWLFLSLPAVSPSPNPSFDSTKTVECSFPALPRAVTLSTYRDSNFVLQLHLSKRLCASLINVRYDAARRSWTEVLFGRERERGRYFTLHVESFPQRGVREESRLSQSTSPPFQKGASSSNQRLKSQK